MFPFILMAAMIGGLPQLNVEKNCKATSVNAVGVGDSYKSCVSEEQAARQRLQKAWPSYTAVAKDTCVSNSQITISMTTYTEIETCFQMQDWKKQLDQIGGTHVPGARPQAKTP